MVAISTAMASVPRITGKTWPDAATAALRVAFGIVWAIDASFKWDAAFSGHFVGYLQNSSQGQPSWLHWWFNYHCGTPPTLMHMANGMYGAIIVDPKTPLPPAAASYVIVQSEWYTQQVSGTTM